MNMDKKVIEINTNSHWTNLARSRVVDCVLVCLGCQLKNPEGGYHGLICGVMCDAQHDWTIRMHLPLYADTSIYGFERITLFIQLPTEEFIPTEV